MNLYEYFYEYKEFSLISRVICFCYFAFIIIITNIIYSHTFLINKKSYKYIYTGTSTE